MADKIKLVIAFALAASAVAGFYMFSEQSLLLRVLGLLVVVGITLAIVYQTEVGRGAWGYVIASRNEVRKVVWPSRQETTQTTMMVVAMVFVMALLLWIIDWFLAQGVQMLTTAGG